MLFKYIELVSIDDKKLAGKMQQLTLHANTVLERAMKLLQPFKIATKLVCSIFQFVLIVATWEKTGIVWSWIDFNCDHDRVSLEKSDCIRGWYGTAGFQNSTNRTIDESFFKNREWQVGVELEKFGFESIIHAENICSQLYWTAASRTVCVRTSSSSTEAV